MMRTSLPNIQIDFIPANKTCRRLTTAWLILGVGALALAGIFAILLVLARMPGLERLFPTQDFFRTALVVHVDQSVLIWFLAFGGVLWSLDRSSDNGSTMGGWIALTIAVAGAFLVAAAPFFGAANPLMNNYVPVLRDPLFLVALALFGSGILLQLLFYLSSGRKLLRNFWNRSLNAGLVTAAIATLAAIGALLWTWLILSNDWQGVSYYEHLFWGGGHILQFAFTQLMLVAWIWLAQLSGIQLALPERWLTAILVLGVTPLLLVPFIYGFYELDSTDSRLAFIRLMQYGNGLAAIPIGLLLLLGLWRSRSTRPARALRAPYYALLTSLLLFAAGGLLGALIFGVNTIIPAHYHGSIVGVTLAFMGLTYILLPELGFARPENLIARLQPGIYAFGQLLHIGGLAYSGAMGIQRKTAGEAQGLDAFSTKLAMGVMGVGGLLAIIGGILFVLVVVSAFLRRDGAA